MVLHSLRSVATSEAWSGVGVGVGVYGRPVVERPNSFMRTDGILDMRRLATVEVELVDEVGDEALMYSPSTYWASLTNVVRFSRRV